MIKESTNTCHICGNDWAGYRTPYFTPRWCPDCKEQVFEDREMKARDKSAPTPKPRKKRTKVEAVDLAIKASQAGLFPDDGTPVDVFEEKLAKKGEEIFTYAPGGVWGLGDDHYDSLSPEVREVLDASIEELEDAKAGKPVAFQNAPDVINGKMQVLVCEVCLTEWERPAKRGRKPRVCPSCKD